MLEDAGHFFLEFNTAKTTLRDVRRLAALLDVLPLQIPALRHSSTNEGGGQHSAAQRSGAARTPLSRRGPIPYVKPCGLRLPDTLTPAVDEPHEAQVVLPSMNSGYVMHE